MTKGKNILVFLFVMFFATIGASAQQVGGSADNGEGEKDNWTITTEDGVTTFKYNGNRRVNGVALAQRFAVNVVAKVSQVSFDGGSSTEIVAAIFKTSQIGNVKMTVTGNGIKQSELTLKTINDDGSAKFEGYLMLENQPLNAESPLIGTLSLSGDKNTSIVSFNDLISNCPHNYTTVNMKYGTTETILLQDDKFYFEAQMSPLQHKLMINSVDYNVSNSGQVWVAFNKESPLELSFYKKPLFPTPGTLYTLNRSGYVDLGIGVLWADKNVGANEYTEPGESFDYLTANNGTTIKSPARMPSPDDFSFLLDENNCHRVTDGFMMRIYRKSSNGEYNDSEPYIIIQPMVFRTSISEKVLKFDDNDLWSWTLDFYAPDEVEYPIRPICDGYCAFVTAVADFNNCECSYPILTLTEDIASDPSDPSPVITRDEGVIDLNGHSINYLRIQNNSLGKAITLKNGIITDDIDGEYDFSDYYKGTVILENMTVADQIWTDGHDYVINSGTYYELINIKDMGAPGTVTINGGNFFRLTNDVNNGTFYLNGGKYKQNPETLSLDITIAPGKQVYDNGEAADYRYEVR